MRDEDWKEQDVRAQAGILCLTKDEVLARDIAEALFHGGLAAHMKPSLGKAYRAIVVDVDGLDRRSAVILRYHARKGAPVVVIADQRDHLQHFGVPLSAWFRKPLISEQLLLRLMDVLAEKAAMTKGESAA